MSRSLRVNVRSANEFYRLVKRHPRGFYMFAPNVADTLLSLKVVFGDLFHSDGTVLKTRTLCIIFVSSLQRSVHDHEQRDDDDYQNVEKNDPLLFQLTSSDRCFPA